MTADASLPEITALTWALAFAPIAALLVLTVGRSWGGAKAGPAALLVALAVSVTRFGAGPTLLALSQAKAALLSVWVLYIIWAALFLYHLVDETGSIRTIGAGLSRITGRRSMQVLLLAWIFTSFLQGIAGYGVPVAVVAPLMVALGFTPVAAVVTTSIGHSWSVTFGSLAASFFVLAGVSGIPGTELALSAAVLLGLACFLCGIGAVWAYGGRKALREVAVPIALVGAVMAVTQLTLAMLGAYSLAAFGAGCTGLLTFAAIARLPRYRAASPGTVPATGEPGGLAEGAGAPKGVSARSFVLAFSAYAILVVIVLAANLFGPLGEVLGRVRIELPFPTTSTDYGWTNAATRSYRTILPFGDAGALLLYAALAGYVVYRRSGLIGSGALRRAAGRTVTSAVSSSIGIVTMVGMALVMIDSGMTDVLARGMADVAGPAFPLVSPFIGVLGAFMTGSNTNSNILFGALQRDSAVLLALPPAIILAAQTTGGAIGSMLAPAKIIVGCSTVGLAGQEAPVIRAGVRYGLTIALFIGLATLVWSAIR